MPFTASHAAAVLPFVRILPASALVCGSIAPDVPYYVWTPFGEMSTHSVTGAFGIDVLLAAMVWMLWHGLIAGPALEGAPYEMRARCASVRIGLRSRVRDARDVVTLYVAFAFGALTHVIWDSFTHPHRWGTEHVDVLNEVYLERPVSHWLQLASTAVGAGVLCLYARTLWRKLPHAATDLSPISVGATVGWLSVTGAACVGAILGAVEFAGGGTGHGLSYLLLTRSVSTAALVGVAVCVVSRYVSENERSNARSR